MTTVLYDIGVDHDSTCLEVGHDFCGMQVKLSRAVGYFCCLSGLQGHRRSEPVVKHNTPVMDLINFHPRISQCFIIGHNWFIYLASKSTDSTIDDSTHHNR